MKQVLETDPRKTEAAGRRARHAAKTIKSEKYKPLGTGNQHRKSDPLIIPLIVLTVHRTVQHGLPTVTHTSAQDKI